MEDRALFRRLFPLDPSLEALEEPERTSLGWCVIMWGCPLEEVPLVRRWKQAYDRCAEKGALHTARDWEGLPDPLRLSGIAGEPGGVEVEDGDSPTI